MKAGQVKAWLDQGPAVLFKQCEIEGEAIALGSRLMMCTNHRTGLGNPLSFKLAKCLRSTKKLCTMERWMSDYDAIGIAEGFVPHERPEEYFEAWQHLINTGLSLDTPRLVWSPRNAAD